tara:strand:+ start:9131 stop:10117 length:987 start_codon:yes stop_codon:yes gene_type:complete
VSSNIDITKPESGSATTSSVRDNFGHTKTEILEMQRMTEDKVVTTGDYDEQIANFTNQDVVLAEGVRISIEVGSLSGGANSANDTATPTLDVDGTGAKTIIRQDGSALVAGDLKAGQYCDLIYDSTATKWVWLNSKTDAMETAEKASPTFTGTPAAPTASKNTNTTQLATTAFVMAQTASATESGIAELATAAEVIAGTDTSRVITPATLLRVAAQNPNIDNDGGSDNFHGSLEIAGVVIKWGLFNSTSDSEQQFWFKTTAGDASPGEPTSSHKNPFPNFGSVALITRLGTNFDSDLGVSSVTANYFTVDRNDGISNPQKLFYIAIGG